MARRRSRSPDSFLGYRPSLGTELSGLGLDDGPALLDVGHTAAELSPEQRRRAIDEVAKLLEGGPINTGTGINDEDKAIGA